LNGVIFGFMNNNTFRVLFINILDDRDVGVMEGLSNGSCMDQKANFHW